MATYNYGNPTTGTDITITGLTVSETDVGLVLDSFVSLAPVANPNSDSFGLSGIDFGGFAADIVGPNSSETLVFSANVTSSDPTQLISSFDTSFIVDTFYDPVSTSNLTFTAVEQVYDTSGHLLGTQSWSFGQATPAPFVLAQAQSSIHVVLTVTEAIGPGGANVNNANGASTVSMSDMQMNFGTIPATTTGGGGGTPGISVLKTPCKVVVNACGQITYNFAVTNTGTVGLSNVHITDNIGTAAAPDFTTPKAVLTSAGYNVGDTNHDGILSAGETWQYTEVVNQISCNTSSSGSVCNKVSGTNLGSGCTAWLSTSFKPTNCHDGATYVFQGVKCTISGGGVGSKPLVETCGDAIVTFSKNCTQATTTYDATRNCWVTTVPADSNPGSVFCSGIPVQVPSGCNLSGATCTWSVDDSSNNCGTSSVSWQGSCQGYQTFNQNGCNGQTNYNSIGVKVCDNQTGYGSGGCTTQGYGYSNGGYAASCTDAQNQSGWIGSGSDCAGTAENLNTASNCGTTTVSNQNNTCHFIAKDSNLGSGNVAWLSSTFQPTSCKDGNSYTFKGITCTISQNGKPTLTEKMPDSVVTFSSSCKSATTHFDAASNCWVTVLPAGTNPGNVFMTGIPCTVPSGYNLNGATISWSVGQTSNNCGQSTLSWEASCDGYSNFNQNGHNGCADYNQIGVKACDNTGDYGCGGNINSGYGWNGTCNTGGSYSGGSYGWGSSWGGGCFGWNQSSSSSSYTCSGWQGSTSDSCGTAENQNTSCNTDDNANVYNNCYSGYNCYSSYNTCSGYSGGDQGNSCGTGTLCEGSTQESTCGTGTLGMITTGIAGAADTVTVTATTATGTTVTATDTKEVQILNNCTNVSVDGTATTSSLTSVYGGAKTLEFTYSPSNTVALKQVQAGLGTVSGSNSNTMAFIEITNQNSPFASGATIYFEGAVTTGEKIFADATLNEATNTPIANGHFSTTAGADLYAYVFTSEASFQAGQAPVQAIAYNTSGSQAMHLGDQIGSLTLVGYVGTNGGHLAS